MITMILFVSCDKELDQYSNLNSFEKVAFQKYSDYRFALDGVYDAMKLGGYFSGGDAGNQNIMADLTSDNLIQSPLGRLTNTRATLHEFGSDEGQTTALYSAAYFAISRANFILENLRTNSSFLTSLQKTEIEAEARALRGIIHFDLVRAYSKIPTQSLDANSSIGIVYVESTENIPYSRNLTVSQVYSKILNDLEFAKTNIPAANATPAPFTKGRLNKAAIFGLLSRVYLHMGDNTSALLNAESCIALVTSVGSTANFPLVWNNTSQDGTLFEILNSDAERVTTGVSYNQIVASNIRSEFVVYKSVYDLYALNDIRKSAYFQVSPYSSESFINVIKYNTRGSLPNVVNYKYLRNAEVYLNGAEAAYLSNPTRALSLLNTLRQQRYTGFVNGTETGTALFNAIQLQRRLELFGEADRWYTLKRLGLPLNRTTEGSFSNGNGSATTSLTLVPSSFKWQWPIPKSAIDLNPGIIQNSGY